MLRLADPNLTRCAECNAHLSEVAEYHPYGYCVLVKAGYDPQQFVRVSVRDDPALRDLGPDDLCRPDPQRY